MKSDTRYFLRRASEEARRAISSEQPEAAEAHEALSVLHSAKALILLNAEDEESADKEERAAASGGKASPLNAI